MGSTTNISRRSGTKTLASLVAHDSALTILGHPDAEITGISIDSREVRPGDLFAALRGSYYDGHAFAEQAIAAGAGALLVQERVDTRIPQVVASDSRAALSGIAAAYFDHPSSRLSVIGVTGTDGKTTTCSLIDDVLRTNGGRTGLIGTIAVRIADQTLVHETRQTTPESVEVQRYLRSMVDAGVEWSIVEATSHGLDLHRLDDVDFRIAAVTNISHEHLEHHKTIAAYSRAKGLLFERVRARGGTAVVNLDDAGACEMLGYASGTSVVTYAIQNQSADVRADDVKSDVSGSAFLLRLQGTVLECRLPMVGDFNVENALCAAAVGLSAAVPATVIRDALEHPTPVMGRMMAVDEGQPFGVLVDYAHTPESLKKVLSLLRSIIGGGRVIVVSGSAGERDVEKRPLQGAVCQLLADLSVFTTEDPRFEDPEKIIAEIAAGAIAAGGVDGHTIVRITDRRQAVRHALHSASTGDVVLLAGKGHEKSIIWGLEKRPWDEDQVARELLHELGYRKFL